MAQRDKAFAAAFVATSRQSSKEDQSEKAAPFLTRAPPYYHVDAIRQPDLERCLERLTRQHLGHLFRSAFQMDHYLSHRVMYMGQAGSS